MTKAALSDYSIAFVIESTKLVCPAKVTYNASKEMKCSKSQFEDHTGERVW